MRPLIDRNQASGYLQMLPHLKPKLFRSKRPMELAAHYQEILASGEPENCLLLLKELYLKERELFTHSKKLGQVDSKYLKVVERMVCEEFAVALNTTPDSMKSRLYAAMQIKQ